MTLKFLSNVSLGPRENPGILPRALERIFTALGHNVSEQCKYQPDRFEDIISLNGQAQREAKDRRENYLAQKVKQSAKDMPVSSLSLSSQSSQISQDSHGSQAPGAVFPLHFSSIRFIVTIISRLILSFLPSFISIFYNWNFFSILTGGCFSKNTHSSNENFAVHIFFFLFFPLHDALHPPIRCYLFTIFQTRTGFLITGRLHRPTWPPSRTASASTWTHSTRRGCRSWRSTTMWRTTCSTSTTPPAKRDGHCAAAHSGSPTKAILATRKVIHRFSFRSRLFLSKISRNEICGELFPVL